MTNICDSRVVFNAQLRSQPRSLFSGNLFKRSRPESDLFGTEMLSNKDLVRPGNGQTILVYFNGHHADLGCRKSLLFEFQFYIPIVALIEITFSRSHLDPYSHVQCHLSVMESGSKIAYSGHSRKLNACYCPSISKQYAFPRSSDGLLTVPEKATKTIRLIPCKSTTTAAGTPRLVTQSGGRSKGFDAGSTDETKQILRFEENRLDFSTWRSCHVEIHSELAITTPPHSHKLAPTSTPLCIKERLSPLSYRVDLPPDYSLHDGVSII